MLENTNLRKANINGISNNKVLTIKLGSRLVNINYSDIMFIETSSTINKLILHAKNRQL